MPTSEHLTLMQGYDVPCADCGAILTLVGAPESARLDHTAGTCEGNPDLTVLTGAIEDALIDGDRDAALRAATALALVDGDVRPTDAPERVGNAALTRLVLATGLRSL